MINLMHRPKSIGVCALTVTAIGLGVLGVGYALSCDNDARTRGRFDGNCWTAGAAIAVGGGTTAAGTWKRNPYIREKREKLAGGVDPEAVLDKLNDVENEIIALRASVDTILRLETKRDA